MDRRTRSDSIYDELNDFIANKNAREMSMTCYKRECKKLEKYIVERKLRVKVIKTKNISRQQLVITLKKF